MVRSTYSSFPHSKCRRLILATSKMNFFRYNWSEKFFSKILGNAENQTRGCWVRSANATSVLCPIPIPPNLESFDVHLFPLSMQYCLRPTEATATRILTDMPKTISYNDKGFCSQFENKIQ